MVLPREYGLGTVVSFRYLAPKANDRMPMVLILTPKHMDGYAHGINLRYISPIQVQQLQHYFKTPWERAKDFINPFKQQAVEDYQKQLEQQREDEEGGAQEPQEGYVIAPDPNNSTFGVSTFTRTVGAVARQARGAFGKLGRFLPFGGRDKPPPPPPKPSPFANVTKQTVPQINDPAAFYYQYVKPILGVNTKNAYRKYNPQYIRNLRIVKGVRGAGF